jgi:hypothetical protein
MTKHIVDQFPIVARQLEQAKKAAMLLDQAAAQVRDQPVSTAIAFRGAAMLATTAAHELLVTAGMLELLDSAGAGL